MENTKIKILIVEDDESLYQMYKLKFEKEWYEVMVANNWLQASSKVADFKPDMILLDIMMPDMDWFETLSVMRQQSSLKTKIIMLSNLDKKQDLEKAMQLWADDYIIKANTTPREVVERVRELLNLKEEIQILQHSDSIQTISVKCPHCDEYIKISINLNK